MYTCYKDLFSIQQIEFVRVQKHKNYQHENVRINYSSYIVSP